MSFSSMKIGEYYNVENTADLACVFEQVDGCVKRFKSDLFIDFANMREIMNECKETRRIWSIRKCGTWYVCPDEYECIVRMSADDDSIVRYIVETNSDGEMTITRIA